MKAEDLEKLKHENRLKELDHQLACQLKVEEFRRGTERLKHDLELERQRIKNAEIRKNLLRKQSFELSRGQVNG